MQRFAVLVLVLLFASPAYSIPPSWSNVVIQDIAGGFASGPLPLSLVATNPFCSASAFATATATVSDLGGKLQVEFVGTADENCNISVSVDAVANFLVPADGDSATQILWTLSEESSSSSGLDEFAFQATRGGEGAVSVMTGGRFKHPEVSLSARTGPGAEVLVDRVGGLHAFIPGDTISMPWVVSANGFPSTGGAVINETFTLEASMLSQTVPMISGGWNQLILSAALLTIGTGVFVARRRAF